MPVLIYQKKPTSVKNLIIAFTEKVQKQTIIEIEEIIKRNGRFTIIFDEWSSKNDFSICLYRVQILQCITLYLRKMWCIQY